MPRGERKATHLPAVAQLYLGALDVALTAADPDERIRAGRFMRDICDEIKARRTPIAAVTQMRYDIDRSYGRPVPGDGTAMHHLVQDVLDHRICGTGDDD